MKRPSFQFYPADWQSNPNLRRCTHAEKGMWMDIMCLLADGDDFGILRWPLKEIATAIGVPPTALKGLVTKGVIKGSDTRCEAFVYIPRSGRKDGDPVTLIPEQDGPIWFSSRMVTDEYKTSVREKNLPKKPQNISPSGSPLVGNGEPKDTHPSVHPSRGSAPAAPSSSSSSSEIDVVVSADAIERALRSINAWDDPNLRIHGGRVKAWLEAGADLDLDIIPALQAVLRKTRADRGDPHWYPSSLNYFDRPVADALARRTKPMPIGGNSHDGTVPSRSSAGRKPLSDHDRRAAIFDIFANGVENGGRPPGDGGGEDPILDPVR